VIVFALIVAAATLGAGMVVALAIRRLPTVRLQLVGLALLGVLLPLAAVVLSGVVMFHSGHDLTILAVAAASSTAALLAALLLGRSIVRPLERLRATSTALAAGDLGARAEPGGAREVAEVGRSRRSRTGSPSRTGTSPRCRNRFGRLACSSTTSSSSLESTPASSRSSSRTHL
jgi:methyl-accepting chemotaxis protein